MSFGALRDLIAATVFLTFVAWGLRSGALGSRRSVGCFIAFVVVVSFGVGLSQRVSLFPFIGWTLLGPVAPKEFEAYTIVAVDSEGKEHPIDYRAWQPVSWWELPIWLRQGFPQLDEAERGSVGTYLLLRAERARRAAEMGRSIGTYGRTLGPLAAPLFVTFRPIWSDPHRVPGTPFLGLRIYRDSWNIEERAADSTAVTRVLIFEGAP